ncbi:MAG: hypothetical protein KJ070_18050 [Verrucomicrobia bacterium]|nr:hypothetical protein [Verrucomicrobiota bacterium]
MNPFLPLRPTLLLLAFSASLLGPARLVVARDIQEPITDVRKVYAAERRELMAEALQLTAKERTTFLPVYERYWAEREKLGDELVKLVLEYADAYPNVSEAQAAQMLKDYTALERKLAERRTAQFQKAAKTLPATKALRYAQLENRMDLVLRRQLASVIPLLPIEGQLTGEAAAALVMAAGEPGGAAVQTYELTARVIGLDQARRQLTLLGPDGIKQTVTVGPEAVNFDQIQVDDQLKVTVAEALVVAMADESEPPGTAAAGLVALAPVGAKPGGLVAKTVQVTARVTALDGAARKATLQFEDGTIRTVAVSRNVDLSQRNVGDRLVIRLTEAVAIAVQKP